MIHAVIGAMIVLVSQHPASYLPLATLAAPKAAPKAAAPDKDKKVAEKKPTEQASENKPAVQDSGAKEAADKATSTAGASGMGGSYSKVALDHADEAIFTLDGKLVSMTGDVRLTLTPTDPASPPVSIQTRKLTASYAEGSKPPSHLLLEGKVAIDHPQGKVRAERADWDFAKNALLFSGSPVMDSPTAKGVEADQILLSFGDGRLKLIGNARVKEGLPLNASAASSPSGSAPAATGSALLKDSDIKDWPAFIAQLKKQASEPAASPGRQIASLLDAKVQRAIVSATPEQVVEQKEAVLKQLNKAIVNPGLYSEAAWKGIALDDETTALLKKDGRSPQEQVRLNRLLVSAAYPDLVAKPPKE